ncbi:MAG: hypothetical protein ACP5T9_03890, partial [Thermoplasmata archaeon]
ASAVMQQPKGALYHGFNGFLNHIHQSREALHKGDFLKVGAHFIASPFSFLSGLTGYGVGKLIQKGLSKSALRILSEKLPQNPNFIFEPKKLFHIRENFAKDMSKSVINEMGALGLTSNKMNDFNSHLDKVKDNPDSYNQVLNTIEKGELGNVFKNMSPEKHDIAKTILTLDIQQRLPQSPSLNGLYAHLNSSVWQEHLGLKPSGSFLNQLNQNNAGKPDTGNVGQNNSGENNIGG